MSAVSVPHVLGKSWLTAPDNCMEVDDPAMSVEVVHLSVFHCIANVAGF